MLVSEAIALLQLTELKQLNLKSDTSTILGYLNLSILEIYKRFPLWEAEAIITQVDGVSLYTLDDSDSNVSMSLSDHTLLMIDRIYDKDDKQCIINNEKEEYSIEISKYHQIKINKIVPGDILTVKYKAAPLFLTATTQKIPLPSQFIEALFLYVSYKAQTSIKLSDKDALSTQYMRFNASCDRIKREGVYIQNDLESNKFETRGFV